MTKKLVTGIFLSLMFVLQIYGADQEAGGKSTLLLKYVLDSLTKIFMYDSVGFTNQERFQLIVQPLINQVFMLKIFCLLCVFFVVL